MNSLTAAVEQAIFYLAKKKTTLDYITTPEVMLRLSEQEKQETRAAIIEEIALAAERHKWILWAGLSGPLIEVRSISGML